MPYKMSSGPNTLSELVSEFIDSTLGYNAQAFDTAPPQIKKNLNNIFTDITWCIFIFVVVVFILSLLAFFVGKRWYLLILLVGVVISGFLIMTVLGLIIKSDIYGIEDAIFNVIQPFTTEDFKNYINTCSFDDIQLSFSCTGKKLN